MSRIGAVVNRAFMKSSLARALALLAFVLVLTSCFSPPRRSAPLASPRNDSALVIFISAGQLPTTPTTKIYDDRAELLGALKGRSWFAVARPPGPQHFFTGRLQRCAGTGDLGIGVLRADLLPGQVYVVRLAIESFREDLAHDYAACCPASAAETTGGAFRHVELRGVVPGSPAWALAGRILQDGRAYATAPRGIVFGEHPDPGTDVTAVLGIETRDAAGLLAQGRARFEMGCIDAERSTLRPEHGDFRLPGV